MKCCVVAQAAEAAKRKAEEEVAKVRATASAAAERAEAQLRTVQERLQAAETSAKMHEAEARLGLLGLLLNPCTTQYMLCSTLSLHTLNESFMICLPALP